MRHLVLYFRQVFCRHDWQTEEFTARELEGSRVVRSGIKIYSRCRKCGFHTRHWRN